MAVEALVSRKQQWPLASNTYRYTTYTKYPSSVVIEMAGKDDANRNGFYGCKFALAQLHVIAPPREASTEPMEDEKTVVEIEPNLEEIQVKSTEQKEKVAEATKATPNIPSSGVSDERFSGTYGRAIRLLDNGRICEDIGGLLTGDSCVLGARAYSKGIHYIRLKIANGTPFVGIVSQSVSLAHPRFYKFPIFVKTPTVHGWRIAGVVVGGSDYHYYPPHETDAVVNGEERVGSTEKWTARQGDNIFVLILDCDGRKLSLLKESTRQQHDMTIDLALAPFPWRLFIVFCDMIGRVCLL